MAYLEDLAEQRDQLKAALDADPPAYAAAQLQSRLLACLKAIHAEELRLAEAPPAGPEDDDLPPAEDEAFDWPTELAGRWLAESHRAFPDYWRARAEGVPHDEAGPWDHPDGSIAAAMAGVWDWPEWSSRAGSGLPVD